MNNKNLKFGCFTPFWLRLQALFLGFLLLTSLPALCLAQENVTRTKSISFIAGSAKGKLTDEEPLFGIKDTDFNTQNTRGFMFDIALGDDPNLRSAFDRFSGGKTVTTKGIGVCTDAFGIPFFCDYEHTQTLRVSETDFGVRYYTAVSPDVAWYAGAGSAFVNAAIDSNRSGPTVVFLFPKITANGSGYYFGVGARRVFDNGFTLGFDLRDSSAEFALKGVGEDKELEKQDYGLTRTSLTLGYSW